MEERYVYKMVKTLPKQTGKMHFALDSCTGGWFSTLVLSSNLLALRCLEIL